MNIRFYPKNDVRICGEFDLGWLPHAELPELWNSRQLRALAVKSLGRIKPPCSTTSNVTNPSFQIT
jgi:hypothetical protein